MTAPVRDDVTFAEANWGRWVATCPRPYCTNALALYPRQTLFVCMADDGCGYVADVVWPTDPDAIQTVLMMRPVAATRNWKPGETIDDLLMENAAHGCLPPSWAETADALGGVLLVSDIVDGRVVGGVLHEQLEAAGRRHEIGSN